MKNRYWVDFNDGPQGPVMRQAGHKLGKQKNRGYTP